MHLVFPSNEISEIIKNSLDVDEEFCAEIAREIITEGKSLTIKYKFDAKYLKTFKKSLSCLYENLRLVILTIKDFSPEK